MNEEQEKLFNKLYKYATEIRNDWSDFDGRDLVSFISQWIDDFRIVSENE